MAAKSVIRDFPGLLQVFCEQFTAEKKNPRYFIHFFARLVMRLIPDPIIQKVVDSISKKYHHNAVVHFLLDVAETLNIAVEPTVIDKIMENFFKKSRRSVVMAPTPKSGLASICGLVKRQVKKVMDVQVDEIPEIMVIEKRMHDKDDELLHNKRTRRVRRVDAADYEQYSVPSTSRLAAVEGSKASAPAPQNQVPGPVVAATTKYMEMVDEWHHDTSIPTTPSINPAASKAPIITAESKNIAHPLPRAPAPIILPTFTNQPTEATRKTVSAKRTIFKRETKSQPDPIIEPQHESLSPDLFEDGQYGEDEPLKENEKENNTIFAPWQISRARQPQQQHQQVLSTQDRSIFDMLDQQTGTAPAAPTNVPAPAVPSNVMKDEKSNAEDPKPSPNDIPPPLSFSPFDMSNPDGYKDKVAEFLRQQKTPPPDDQSVDSEEELLNEDYTEWWTNPEAAEETHMLYFNKVDDFLSGASPFDFYPPIPQVPQPSLRKTIGVQDALNAQINFMAESETYDDKNRRRHELILLALPTLGEMAEINGTREKYANIKFSKKPPLKDVEKTLMLILARSLLAIAKLEKLQQLIDQPSIKTDAVFFRCLREGIPSLHRFTLKKFVDQIDDEFENELREAAKKLVNFSIF